MKYSPYFSIAIETTGTNIEFSQVVRIVMVYDDGHTPIEKLSIFECLIKPETHYYEFLTMSNIGSTLKRLHEGKNIKKVQFVHQFEQFLKEVNHVGKIILSGINLNKWMLPILTNNKIFIPNLSENYFDIPGAFFLDYGYEISLEELNKKANYEGVGTDIKEQALNTITLIRHKFSNGV